MEKQLAALNKIQELYKRIENNIQKSLIDAIRIGEILTEQKAEFKHAEWLPFVETLPFSERKAQNYMGLYKNREKIEKAGLGIKDSLNMLANKSISVANLPDNLPELPAETNILYGFSNWMVAIWLKTSQAENKYYAMRIYKDIETEYAESDSFNKGIIESMIHKYLLYAGFDLENAIWFIESKNDAY